VTIWRRKSAYKSNNSSLNQNRKRESLNQPCFLALQSKREWKLKCLTTKGAVHKDHHLLDCIFLPKFKLKSKRNLLKISWNYKEVKFSILPLQIAFASPIRMWIKVNNFETSQRSWIIGWNRWNKRNLSIQRLRPPIIVTSHSLSFESHWIWGSG
jgi:hypothetical protein